MQYHQKQSTQLIKEIRYWLPPSIRKGSVLLVIAHTWKTVTIAHRSESKFLRLHSQRPAITSLQLHRRWLFVFREQNFPPNKFIPRMLTNRNTNDHLLGRIAAGGTKPRKMYLVRPTMVVQDTGKKVAHNRLPSVGFRGWSRLLAVSLQVTWVINTAVGCYYFPPGPQLLSQPLRQLLPISLLGEQRHDGCEQFA